jgi:flagellar basal body-associated protein FliL
MPLRRTSLVASTVLAAVVAVVGASGCATQAAGAGHVAYIPRTRVELNDATCTFATAVTLRAGADPAAFEVRQAEVRDALVAILRTKSRYMVSSATAREAVRRQMLREVNRVLDGPVADELQFTEFVLS